MNIQFKTVQLHNFMSFTDSTINLNVPGYILVCGENNNKEDNSKSNGSGKSSVFEAILWCLTGETQRGSSAKNIIRLGEKEAFVKLWFSVDKDDYEVTRSIEKTQSLQIIKNGEDISGKGIKASTQILAEQLPEITMGLLSNIVILGQGLPNKFTSATPSGRKDSLEKMFKTDFMIEDIKTRINDRLTILKDEQRQLEDSILTLDTKINIAQENIDSAQQTLESMADISELQSKVKLLDEELFELNGELTFYKQQNEDILLQNESTNALILALTQEKIQINNSDFLLDDIENIKEKGIALKSEVLALDKEIEKKENIVDICPTCGQKLVGVEKPDTTKDKKQSKLMKEELDRLRIQLRDLQKQRQDEIDTKLNKVDTEIARLNTQLKSTIDTSDIERSITLKQKEFDELNNELAVFNNKKQELKNTINSNSANKETLEKDRNSLDVQKVKLDARIDVDNKINTVIKRDFRGYLLSNIISLLNNICKEYSTEVFGHDKLDILQDGNNIAVLYRDKEYTMLSGGEKQKVDVILQLGIKATLEKYMGIQTNILVLDEITDALDSEDDEKILNMITNKLNMPSVYLISHHDDFPVPCDSKIIVKKNNIGSVALQHIKEN